jgi:hypothetical protein
MTAISLRKTLDEFASQGKSVDLWLRDDDAVEPTAALEKLVLLTQQHAIPLTLAVIPEHTGAKLATYLRDYRHIDVAVHGWSHRNYAAETEKKRELGLHRPKEIVLSELTHGFEKLHDLYPGQFISMLVPPWNRIDDGMVDGLPDIGYQTLSVFGRNKPASLPLLNTHIDLMDWHGTGGGRPHDALFEEIATRLRSEPQGGSITGILTHHLVHDDVAWAFLEKLFELTANHPAISWRASRQLMATLSP